MSAHTPFVFLLLAVLLTGPGCSSPDPSQGRQDASQNGPADVAVQNDTRGDVGPSHDGAGEDVPDTSSPADDTVRARDYCETVVDFFCEYYLRCGRTAAEDSAECRTTFLETCNEVYEPRYTAYVEAGLLELSSSGIEQCESHLGTVRCEEQLFDLDGGCSDVWRGLVPAGGACAPGIGSFVCDGQSKCTLGLDLCGTCEAAADDGEDCSADDVTCQTGSACVDGTCMRRGFPGDACGDDQPCVLGASCVDGECLGFDVAAVGEECGADARCPYQSSCRDQTCVASASLGESCEQRDCASGWCDQTICRPLFSAGQRCAGNTQCVSGVCDGGTCQPLPGACFE